MVANYIKRRKKCIDRFNEILPEIKNCLPIKVESKKPKKCSNNVWFNCGKITMESVKNNFNYKTKSPKQVINSQKIKMKLTNEQKQIINSWMDGYTNMYNETLNYIRGNCPLFKNEVTRKKISQIDMKKWVNSIYLRGNLKNIRKCIQNNTQCNNINYDTKIHTHTLDYAIRQIVSNLKSAITNTSNGNFKKFRIKYWKHTRPSKTIEIEKCYVNCKNKVCFKILKDIKYEYNNKDYELPLITSNVKINYNSVLNEYFLLIPHKNIPTEINNKTRNIIILDPGLRTFMTGLSEKESINIGTNVHDTIKDKIKRLNKIKSNEKIPNKIKKKNETRINRKIRNLIDDLHWKTIGFLTSTFKNVLLGDMSAKSIVKKSNSFLSKEAKTACLRTRFYEFKQRLEYKCLLTKTNFRYVDEKYTSKLCSNCGNYNDKLKGEKVYDCSNCKLKLDRDVNACRNIMFKTQMK
jgi:transposase